MTPRIVNAYRIILERANDFGELANRREWQTTSDIFGQHAEGLRTAAAIIKGICSDDAELSKQLKEIRNELNEEDK